MFNWCLYIFLSSFIQTYIFSLNHYFLFSHLYFLVYFFSNYYITFLHSNAITLINHYILPPFLPFYSLISPFLSHQHSTASIHSNIYTFMSVPPLPSSSHFITPIHSFTKPSIPVYMWLPILTFLLPSVHPRAMLIDPGRHRRKYSSYEGE